MTEADARATSTYPARPVDAAELRIADAALEVVAGSAPNLTLGQRLALDVRTAARCYIGRSEVADVRIEDTRISRRHAALEVTEREVRIVDLESKNGTFVNGVRVFGAVLSAGDIVRVGSVDLRLDVVPSATRLALPRATSFGRYLGMSSAVRRLYPVFERAAESRAALVVEGEIGTGKELLAEVLHEQGPHASGPFVVFDCTLPPAGTDGALFVEAPGIGALERARGGTLFLDEIAELAPGYQTTLLHVLRRIDDLRVIVATRRDLEREVQEGRLREDLYYHLAETRIELPPLRQRAGDAVYLAGHFWRAAGGEGPLPEDLVRRATTYAWPGNVRELQNDVTNRIVIGPLVKRADTAPSAAREDVIAQVIERGLGFSEARRHVLDAFEERYLEWILAAHGGNVSRAAAASGIARRYFYTVRRRTRP